MSLLRVSVLLATRDGERYLESSLRSIARQTWPNVEVIAVDDGSHDGTSGILRGFEAQHPKMRIIRTEGIGLAPALVLAAHESTGSLLARQDDDDISHPERFRRQVDFLLKHPEVGVLGTGAMIMDEDGRAVGRLPVPRGSRMRGELRLRPPFVHGSVMMRREVYERAGGYRPGFRVAEDFDLWSRIPVGVGLDNVAEPLYWWRANPQGATARSRARQLFEIAAVREFARQRAETGSDSAELLLQTSDLEAFLEAYPHPSRFLATLGEVHAREGLGAEARDLLLRALRMGAGKAALQWWALSFAGQIRRGMRKRSGS